LGEDVVFISPMILNHWSNGLNHMISFYVFKFHDFTKVKKRQRLWLKELSCIPILALTIENLSLFVYQQNKVYKSQFAHEKKEKK